MAKQGVPKGFLADMALPGPVIVVRVTPGARRSAIVRTPDHLKVATTAPPEDGRANAAVTDLLARALGVAPARLALIRGATSRDKIFRRD